MIYFQMIGNPTFALSNGDVSAGFSITGFCGLLGLIGDSMEDFVSLSSSNIDIFFT